MACTINEEDLETLQELPTPIGSGIAMLREASLCSGQCSTSNCSSTPAEKKGSDGKRPLCARCKGTSAVVVARQRDPLCKACAYDTALGKARHALRLKIGLAPTDTVLLCYSGGHSSRALLQFLLDTQSHDKSRPGRGKVAFDLKIAHVEEGGACGWTEAESLEHVCAIRSSLGADFDPNSFLSLRLEDIYASNDSSSDESAGERTNRRQKLHELIKAVPDLTGKEDLVKALREALLLQVARGQGVTKVARGDNSDRLAARVIALSAKGSGYALPASLHFLDGRHGQGSPLWVSPVRELMAKDLAAVTHLLGLRTVPAPRLQAARGQVSINAIAERFVSGLLANSPSSVHTILATACKLQKFQWSTQVGVALEQTLYQKLCPICSSPLPHTEKYAQPDTASLAGKSCRSCRQQLFGVSPSSASLSKTAADESCSHALEALLSEALLCKSQAVRREEEEPGHAPAAHLVSEAEMREKLNGFLIGDE